MPVKRRTKKARARDLTMSQFWSLSVGECDREPPAFESEAARREAWEVHRERLMAHRHAGTRPDGWWCYESPIPYPGYERERSALYEAGLLSAEEVAEVTAWWREQYDRGCAPEFRCVRGPNDLLQGEAARAAHHSWADIPAALVEQWERDRARPAATAARDAGMGPKPWDL